jgi:hypothetical protein
VADLRFAVVFADYWQFYLQDLQAYGTWTSPGGATDPDLPAAGWTHEAGHVHRIGAEPHSISIGTARNDFVETAVELLTQAPTVFRDSAEHIVEADLDVVSDCVSLYGCTEDPGPEHLIEVTSGLYRVRVSYLPADPPARSSPTVEGTYYCYCLEIWPTADKAPVCVLKQGPTPWAG